MHTHNTATEIQDKLMVPKIQHKQSKCVGKWSDHKLTLFEEQNGLSLKQHCVSKQKYLSLQDMTIPLIQYVSKAQLSLVSHIQK